MDNNTELKVSSWIDLSNQEINTESLESSHAVVVRNATKSYGSQKVLRNFSMSISKRSIYCLLGASGCGKTTVLSCVVGNEKLDSGEVFVFGKSPRSQQSGTQARRIGYMPQMPFQWGSTKTESTAHYAKSYFPCYPTETTPKIYDFRGITLYTKLSIKETILYFGRIYGMADSETLCKLEFLTNFLHLPPGSRIVGSLSGGQQRRVSLAVCLMHDPCLLILDEPTVGVDPLLRESIWNYLCELVSKKDTTVIITTHYIEEARQSNKIGLMRNGRLLTEKSPNELSREYNTPMLEDIVIRLCKNDSNSINDEITQGLNEVSFYSRSNLVPSMNKKSTGQNRRVVGLSFKKTDDESNCCAESGRENVASGTSCSQLEMCKEKGRQKWSKIKALVMRNKYNLMRNPIFLLTMFIFPAFNCSLVSYFIGREPSGFEFGVVNAEINRQTGSCQNSQKYCLQDLSCAYLNTLESSAIKPTFLQSTEQALREVRKGNILGYMEFPKNYSQHVATRVLEGNYATNETLDGSVISFRMDFANYFAGHILKRNFLQTFEKFGQNMLRLCNEDPHKASLPLQFKKPVYGSLEGSRALFVSPAILLVVTFFTPCLTGAIASITDRKDGTLIRSMIAGASKSDMQLAFCITEGFTICVQAVLSHLVAWMVYRGEFAGSHVEFFFILVVTGMAGLCSSFLLAQFCDDEMESVFVLIGAFLTHLTLSGTVWPIESSHPIIQVIAYLLPCNWAIFAARSVSIRGWSLFHSKVWPSIGILFLCICLTWTLAIKCWRTKI